MFVDVCISFSQEVPLLFAFPAGVMLIFSGEFGSARVVRKKTPAPALIWVGG